MPQATGTIIPAPTKGVNFRDNLALMEPDFATWMENIDCNGTNINLRYGHLITSTNAPTGTNGCLGLHVYNAAGLGSDKIFGTVFSSSGGASGIYNFSSASPSLATTATVSSSFYSPSVMFQSHLFVFTPPVSTFGKIYDGSSWADIGYTGPTYIYGATPYKSRLYVLDPVYYGFWYSDLEAVSGALHQYPLSAVFKGGSEVIFATTFATTDGVVNQEYIAFGNDIGEVLVYGGPYPGADGAGWNLVARFKIGRPLGFNQAFSYQGDSLIITNTGLVSMRDLLTKGSAAATNLTVSSAVDTYWKKLVDAQPAGFATYAPWYGVFWPARKKILIGTAGFLEQTGNLTATKSTFFVFDTLTGAWSTYSSTGVGPFLSGLNIANDLCYCSIGLSANGVTISNASIFSLSSTAGTNVFTDSNWASPGGATLTYNYNLNSAWNSFGQQVTTKNLSGFEQFVNTDLYTISNGLTLKASVDFGVQTSASSQPLQATVPTGPFKIKNNVQLDGTFFQYQISGTTSTSQSNSIGLTLYAVNAIFEQGGLYT